MVSSTPPLQTPPFQPSPPPKTSALAIVGLVVALGCAPIGMLLCFLALLRINKSQGQLGGQAVAIVGLALGVFFGISQVGCVAAVAIPNFVKFSCRAKQSEAKVNLKALYLAEESFRSEHGRYGSLEEIGFSPQGEPLRYEYELVGAPGETFEARATAVRDLIEGDVWSVDQSGSPTVVTDRCR